MLGQLSPLTVSTGLSQMVGTGYNRANTHACGNSDPVAHSTLIYKGLLPIYLHFLPLMTSHVTWHFCVQT